MSPTAMTQPHFALYNPSLLTPDELLAEFTARQALLESLLAVVRSNRAGQSPQHCLIIGARGMGKTTTLWAIHHRVNRDSQLAAAWQPVVFDEESRRIGDLADFWLESIRQWEHAVGSREALADHLLEQAAADIEDRARETFLKLVDARGRRALLLIDNLNDVLGAIRDPEPLHRLRAVLMQDSRVMIVGGATRYFDEITSVDQPFYDFFRYFELRPLTLEEVEAALLAQARIRGDAAVERTLKERSGTVRALHLLTGGNPRLVKTFYRLLAEGLRGDIRTELERLIDDFTPYLKALVDALSVQQQRIFDAIALAWDPVEVASIATATRLPSNQVSAQIRALIKSGLIREAAGGPKRKTYLLTDRFSNIHYLMRHGRAARSRLDWFVALVRIVFPDNDSARMLAHATSEAAKCGGEGLVDARSVFQSALARMESKESRCAYMHETLRESWDGKALESLNEWFDATRAKAYLPEADILSMCRHMPAALRKEIGYKPEEAEWWFGLTDFLEQRNELALSEAAYRKAIELNPNWAPPWFGLGRLLEYELNRHPEAVEAYTKAAEIDPAWAAPWYSLAAIQGTTAEERGTAEIYYRKAIGLAPSWASPWVGLGNLLFRGFGRVEEAERAYRSAIELRPQYGYAWVCLGHLLCEKGTQNEAAEAAYRKAAEIDPNDADPWFWLAELLANQSMRVEEAKDAYRKALQLDASDALTWAAYSELIASTGGDRSEARRCSISALSCAPRSEFARRVFVKVCGDRIESWKAVLPKLVEWCAAHPGESQVYSLSTEGFIQLARLESPAKALAFLDSIPDIAPFQTVRDALVAHDNRDHLLTLAPERQSVVLALLDQMNEPLASPTSAPAPTSEQASKPKAKRTKRRPAR